MNKRILSFIAVILLAFGLTIAVTACSGEKGEYSVTVLSPAAEPVSDVTVLWETSSSKTAGNAKTDADGRATASLPLGTYTVSLENYGEEYTYTSVSVSASMRNVTLTLSVKKVNYTVTVTDKEGAPASGVVVTWSNGSFSKNATTDASGAAQCELDYGEYSVTISSLPQGNVYDGAVTVTGGNPSAVFNLRAGNTLDYSVTVKSEGGLLFKEHPIQIYKGDTLVGSGNTNDEGVYAFSVEPGDYIVKIPSVPKGYRFEAVTLTESEREGEVILVSAVIPTLPAEGETYVIGDIFHNYSFKTPYRINGNYWESTVSKILEEKEVLILNNWGTNCSWCVEEMPDMQKIYEKYGDVLEIVAVSNYPSPYDSDSTIINHYNRYGYTFPMMRDTNGFTAKFNLTGWPTTVVIDRYGAIARIEAGAITSLEAWERLIQKYIGDDYVQTFTPGDKVSESINTEIAKPDVVLPANHYDKVAQTLNDTNLFPKGASVVWNGEAEYEYAWPFVLGTDPDVSPNDEVLYASNAGKANSIAIIYATVTVEAGKVFHFDYYAQTEEDADVLSILWDGKIVKEISGDSNGWQTCYLYADLTSGSHTLSFAYIKDGSTNTGKDSVYIRRVGFANITDIPGSSDMLRSAAYGTPDAGAETFPYYADVAIAQDGYYHVNLSTLQNSAFAGNDPSPLLLANLLNATQWAPYSINEMLYAVDEKTGEYVYDCTLTIGGVTRDYRSDFVKYLTAASASDVTDCVPVNQELHDLLVAFMKKVSGNNSHSKEWLEICYFYSHYGDGEPVGNPILGLLDETAIPVTVGTFTADLTRNMNPFPTTRYSFTPETSAVYKIESLIPQAQAGSDAAQIWLYDDTTSSGNPLVYCGDTRITRGGVNEHNFEVYRYLTAGHKYYLALAFQMAGRGKYDVKITEVGQSATVMIPCSDDIYNMVLDKDGNFTGEITLAGAVNYVKDNDGYYRAINPDGTTGDYIYLDVKYACTTALGTIPIDRLVDKDVPDPVDGTGLGYKFFDFRYRIAYTTAADGTINYNPNNDCTSLGEKYKDYTDIVKSYIASAPTSGEYEGLVKVDQQLVDILKLYIEMRVNMLMDGEIDSVMENEWLRFCWYNRTYDANNL